MTRHLAAKDGARLFDLVSGFAYTQVLLAAVELDLLAILKAGPLSLDQVSQRIGVPRKNAEILLNAAAALDLIKKQRDGRYRLARLGAATLGVPGLEQMILHHRMFYDDLSDPVALLRGETRPQLAEFWPYVKGEAGRDIPPETAATYSNLMSESQSLVAAETLATVKLDDVCHLLDIGGGTGAFMTKVLAQYPKMNGTVMDLPSVVQNAVSAEPRMNFQPGSFLEPIDTSADAISLIRVLYDHSDETVQSLLTNIYDTLPSGGLLLISEPMSGGATPQRAGDVYFPLYTLCMVTGRTRSADQISDLLSIAGFCDIKIHAAHRPYVTCCVTCRKAV
ncbi:acetylserotonin O-methyltransferase [Litoreibacter roseus]|uniref:Demethylspheroidene O-methyltransferase n=1 Tax=Litoreibacter roseus TaxID=2601869 RepID=A0A6N6JFN5_9RHOB|nr:acetylserotonin O-methyltransferase [Litoreibacter roseus]GFE64610.1 Demethylspheroidene O-methyltransferase [Litoreibacter roseus]